MHIIVVGFKNTSTIPTYILLYTIPLYLLYIDLTKHIRYNIESTTMRKVIIRNML